MCVLFVEVKVRIPNWFASSVLLSFGPLKVDNVINESYLSFFLISKSSEISIGNRFELDTEDQTGFSSVLYFFLL